MSNVGRIMGRVWLFAVVGSLGLTGAEAADSARFNDVTYLYKDNPPNHPDGLDKAFKVLTDGNTEPGSWTEGGWVGALREKGSPLTIRFDLGKWCRVDRITLHYLQDWKAGITAPSRIQLGFFVSGREVGETITFTDIPDSTATGTQSVTIPLTASTGRFVEVTVFNWRGGWTFLSEVSFAGGLTPPTSRGGR